MPATMRRIPLSRLGILRAHRQAVLTVDSLRLRCLNIEENVTFISARLSDMPRMSGGQDRIARCVAAMDAAEQQLALHLRKMARLASQCERIIKALPTPTLQNFARLYWLTGMSMADTARCLPVCTSYAYKLRDAVEEAVEQPVSQNASPRQENHAWASNP